jgi:hypothetical protein
MFSLKSSASIPTPPGRISSLVEGKVKVLKVKSSLVLKLVEINTSKQKKMEIKLNLRKQGSKQPIGYLEFNKINSKSFANSATPR